MLKKSKVIAVLVVSVMMFAVASPACAWNWWGSIVGCAIGAGAGAFVVLTGGLAAPLIPVVAGGAMIGASVGGADEDPKSNVVAGTGAGLGVTIIYDAVKNVGAVVGVPIP